MVILVPDRNVFEVDVEATESELIERARQASSRAAFVVGECAAVWINRYSRGRTDEDFAKLIGSSRTTVNNQRLVHERFCQTFGKFEFLKWSHYATALNWPDAETCLSWADENRATVAELKAWRRMQHGEDLTVDSEPELPVEDEPELIAPMSAALPATAEADEPMTAERAAAPASPFRNDAIEPAAESIGEQTKAEQRSRLNRILNALTRSFKQAHELSGGEAVVLEHVDRLIDELKRGDDIGGLDERTVDGMLRGAA